MKIGYYDTDPAGGMIPMTVELEGKRIPYQKIDYNTLEKTSELDLLIINFLGLPHFTKKVLKDYCKDIYELINSNPHTKFLIMIPGEGWLWRMNKNFGKQENIDYVTNGDISKLTKLLEENKK